MPNDDLPEIRECWDRLADDWRIQVGDEGDVNRRLNSDPVLWRMVGDVGGLRVLDAGCGTGYLTKQLHDRGASVVGVDLSPRMIEIARRTYLGLEFRVDSCTELATLREREFDLLVSNYVLMDTPDLAGTMRSLARVLKPGGAAVLVFSHPCFPQGFAEIEPDSDEVRYRWDFGYFERRKIVDPPWAHFQSDFIWFHRPLADYWRGFTSAGFAVEDLDEPRVGDSHSAVCVSAKQLHNCRTRPYSIAFKLRKLGAA